VEVRILLEETETRFLLLVAHRSSKDVQQKLVIWISSNSDRLGPSRKYVENSTNLTCLEITGYQIKYSTVLWPLELQVRRGRKV